MKEKTSSPSLGFSIVMIALLFVVSYQFWGVIFSSPSGSALKSGLHNTVDKGQVLYNGATPSEQSTPVSE